MESRTKKRVLVLVDWFAPGYKAGGPITSAVNFVSHMNADLDIFIFTSDRDLGDTFPYSNISVNRWTLNENWKLFYASPDYLTWKNILALIHEVLPDILYLNSMFSRFFTFYPLMMNWLGKLNCQIVLSPRGMLRSSALSSKPLKKKLFLMFLGSIGEMKKIRFHATDKQELLDIKERFGKDINIVMVGNFPGYQKPYTPPLNKKIGELKMIFVGRIHPIKNLHYLLSCLQELRSNVELTIVGPVEDQDYWKKCSEMINVLPDNVRVIHHDGLVHSQILELMIGNHVFVLPTSGENFGHAIFESFACGRPVLISDQTPWRGIEEKKAGWDIALAEKNKFATQIERLAEMDAIEHERWCTGAWQYCRAYLNDGSLRDNYLPLFDVHDNRGFKNEINYQVGGHGKN